MNGQDTMKERKDAAKPERKAVPRTDFWFSIMVLAFVVDFFITVAALCYGIITTPPRKSGEAVRLAFPWMGWLAAMLAAPAAIIGLAQWAEGREGNAAPPQPEQNDAFADQLSGKALRLYRFVKAVPLFVVSLALIGLSATLVTIDSAFGMLTAIAGSLVPYLPYLIGGATVVAVAIAALAVWFRYKNNQLMTEYAFRREVLEKTGVILTGDKAILPPGHAANQYTVDRIAGSDPGGLIVEAEPLRALPDIPDKDGRKTVGQ